LQPIEILRFREQYAKNISFTPDIFQQFTPSSTITTNFVAAMAIVVLL
jgi:hypothetical protein